MCCRRSMVKCFLSWMLVFVITPAVLGGVIVDDHFDDGAIDSNPTGIGSGFNTFLGNSGAIEESDSLAGLTTSTNGGDRATIVSVEGASIGTGITRFEFRSVSFAVGNTNGGSTARNALGVRDDNTAEDVDGGQAAGFWIQFENDSLLSADNSGGWSGTSVLMYQPSGDSLDTPAIELATWEFDRLNWDTGANELSPILDITLDLKPEGYSLTIEGDTITLLTGALASSYEAAGITNELTVGHAFVFIQSENPGINTYVDQIVITENASAPVLATPLRPANKAEDVALDEILEWTPGIYAVTHDVYFGTDYDDVNDASRDNPGEVLVSQGQTETTFIPDEYELDGVYYWRVDEVNENPSTIYKGNVWTFSAEPTAFDIDANNVTVTASSIGGGNPNMTTNGAGLSEDLHSTDSSTMWLSADSNAGEAWIEFTFDQAYTLHEMYVWNYNAENENVLGYGIKEALIEVSADGNEWTTVEASAILNQAAGRSKAAVNSIVEMGDLTVSAVRITALSNWSIFGLRTYGLSEVRFTYVPTSVRLPNPEDGTTDVAVDQVLSWRPGRYASQHEVYMGSDINCMDLIDTVNDAEYAPTDLVYDASYVWSVNEVNETTGISYAGDVWSFSTPAYYTVDDMESYDNGNFIYLTWADGYDDKNDDNTSQVGHDDPPYVEQAIAYDGSQSMPMYYANQNSSMYATAVKSIGGEDWTVGGLQTLTVFFRGDMENDGGQLYVQVNNKKVTSDVSLSVALWTQWNISLSDLGTDLTHVTDLTIGVDGVGEGLIYIDAIRLYREAPEVVTSSDPTSENLVLHYTLEGDLLDQAGQGNHGTSEMTLFYEASLTEDMGQALSFDGAADYVDMEVGNLISTLENSTFAVWVRIDDDADGAWMRAFDVGTGTDNYLFLCPRVGTADGVRLAILTPDLGWETGLTSSSALSDGWHHLAGVFDNGMLSLYIDSQLAGSVSTETYPQDLGVTTQNWLGRSQWEGDAFYNGLMDEVRIYDRALTAGEVRYLAGDR